MSCNRTRAKAKFHEKSQKILFDSAEVPTHIDSLDESGEFHGLKPCSEGSIRDDSSVQHRNGILDVFYEIRG